ncbi:hypothetical protein LTS17_005469 [Exophiala oligosperma]
MELFKDIKKNKRSFYIAGIINIGAILSGFDLGGIGAIVSLPSFIAGFELNTSASKLANTSGTIVTLLNAGAIIGSFAPLLVSQHLGRRYLLMISGLFFLLGGSLQTGSTMPGLGMINAGRVIAGVGVGLISNVSPTFMAECAPKQYRGFMMSLYDLYLIFGGLIGYFAVYGCQIHLAPTSAQWRIPFSLQLPLAAIIVVGAYSSYESPRWLARKDRLDEMRDTLCKLRGCTVEDPALATEIAEILAQVHEEVAATAGNTFRELFIQGNWQRLAWGLSLAMFSTSCGHNVILYCPSKDAPTVFKDIGYVTPSSTILGGGVILIIKLAAVLLFLIGPVEYFGRRTLLMTGTFGMGVCIYILGALLAVDPPSSRKSGELGNGGRAMVAMVYVFQIFYSVSWGPLLWVYLGEIFPNRIREYGMAPCVAACWAFNLLWSKVQPIAILHTGWKTWMIFGTLNVCATILCYFLPETRHLSVEEMDVLFGAVDGQTRANDIDNELHLKGAMELHETADKTV